MADAKIDAANEALDVALTVLRAAREESALRAEKSAAAWKAAVAWHDDLVREAREADAAAAATEESDEQLCDDTAEEQWRAELHRAQVALFHAELGLQEKWSHADGARRVLAHQ